MPSDGERAWDDWTSDQPCAPDFESRVMDSRTRPMMLQARMRYKARWAKRAGKGERQGALLPSSPE